MNAARSGGQQTDNEAGKEQQEARWLWREERHGSLPLMKTRDHRATDIVDRHHHRPGKEQGAIRAEGHILWNEDRRDVKRAREHRW